MIRKWDDKKGYGFVACAGGGRDAFLHVKDIASDQRRPRLGDKVSFEPKIDARGRVCASKPRLKGGGASRGSGYFFCLVLAAAAYALLGLFRPLPLTRATLLIGLYFFWSPIAFAAYWRDKRLAANGGWRVPERVLHCLELVGGWPGALIAQRVLRHKTRKTSYQLIFWGIVLAHAPLWALWALGAD